MKFQYTRTAFLVALLTNFKTTYCADVPNHFSFAKKYVTAIEQATPLPRVLAKIIVDYDGERRFQLKRVFPKEHFPCQETILPSGLHACVLPNGCLITKNLLTNQVIKVQELLSYTEKRKYCVNDQITPLPDGHIAIPLDFWDKNDRNYTRRNNIIKIINTLTNKTTNILYKHYLDQTLRFKFLLLPHDEIVVYHNTSPIRKQKIFDINTGEYKRTMCYGNWLNWAYLDMTLLSDGRVAAAQSGCIHFSNLKTPLVPCTTGQKHADRDILRGHEYTSNLAVLSGNTLVTAGTQSKEFYDVETDCVALRIFDTKKKLWLKEIIVEDETNIDLAHACDGIVAAREHKSGRVGIVHDNSYFRLPLEKKAKSIQGLPNGDLFVQHPDGSKTLWGQGSDMSFYDQVSTY